MSYGTTVGPVKAHLLALLQARPGLAEVAVGYNPPNQQTDVFGPTGLRRAIWMDTVVDGATQAVQALGAPIHWTETWALKVICQVLPRDAADTQDVVDDAVSLLLGEVLALVTADARLAGLTVPGWTIYVVPAGGFKFEGGQLLNSTGAAIGAGARIEVDLRVEASNC